MWGAASPPQSPRAAWHRLAGHCPQRRLLASRPPSEGGGQVGSWGCPQAVLTPAWMGRAPAGEGGCVQEGAGPRSFVGTKLHRLLHAQCDHGLRLHFSPSVLSLNSVLPVRHLRAKARGPQERKGDREAPGDPPFPGRFRNSGGDEWQEGKPTLAKEVPAFSSQNDLLGIFHSILQGRK